MYLARGSKGGGGTGVLTDPSWGFWMFLWYLPGIKKRNTCPKVGIWTAWGRICESNIAGVVGILTVFFPLLDSPTLAHAPPPLRCTFTAVSTLPEWHFCSACAKHIKHTVKSSYAKAHISKNSDIEYMASGWSDWVTWYFCNFVHGVICDIITDMPTQEGVCPLYQLSWESTLNLPTIWRDILIILLMRYFVSIDEDIKLNTTVFHWPDTIKTVFELSQNRIMNRREHAEEDVKKKVQAFEDKLNDYNKEVESFRKKEVGDSNIVNMTIMCEDMHSVTYREMRNALIDQMCHCDMKLTLNMK